MRKSISLVAALALSTTVAYAGYGSNAGYSTTKKINIENRQWVLVGYPGGSAVPTTGGTATYVSAQDSLPPLNTPYNGDIVTPLGWNTNPADVNDTMFVGSGNEDNATFSMEATSDYWPELIAHANFSVTNVGEPAISVEYDSTNYGDAFTNVDVTGGVAQVDNTRNMEIRLDGAGTSTNPILKIKYAPLYEGVTFTLYLDANESNNTSYTMTFRNNAVAYILNDPAVGSSRPLTYQLFEFNTTHGGYGAIGQVPNDNNSSFGASGISNLGLPGEIISADANYTVAKFDSNGQSWMIYEGNLTGGTTVTNSLYDTSGNANQVEKGHAYWYRVNLEDVTTTIGAIDSNELNMSVTVRDEDVGVADISAILQDNSWNLLTLPKGHFKHSQGGIIVPIDATGATYINFKGPTGSIDSISANAIQLTSAPAVNSFVEANGTLFETPLRAYPAEAGTSILIVTDDQLEFNMTTTAVANSIGGSIIGSSGKTTVGEPAVGINLNDGFYQKYVGTLTIEIPDLFSGFTGVDVNLSGLTSSSTITAVRDNIITAMYNQACLHIGGDYNITDFDADFDGTSDSLLIALKAKGDRNVTADGTNPTACTNNGITRDSYNDKYLRIGIRENTYVKPYLSKLDTNSSAVAVVDSAGNIYAKGTLNSDAANVYISDYTSFWHHAGKSLIEGNRSHSYGTYVEFNLTEDWGALQGSREGNYTYFITNSRTIDLVEGNLSEYNLTGASKYSIISNTNKRDVLMDATYLTTAERQASLWSGGFDVNTTLLKGVVSYAYTLADLAQAPLVAGGSLNTASQGIGGYASTTDLNINTLWSVDMPTSGPLYDLVSAMGKPPARIATFRNGSYQELNLEKTNDTTKWFDTEDLFFVSAFNGYWVKTDSTMNSYTVNTPTSQDTGEFIVQTHYDMESGVTSNYVFRKWEVDNVSSTNGLSVSMHNIAIADSNMSAQFTSVTGGADRYEILIDPYTFSDFGETGFAGTKSVSVTNGFESLTADPISFDAFSKPAAPSITGTSNNDLTVAAIDGTLEGHLAYIDEANLSFTRFISTTDTALSIAPGDINLTSQLIEGSYTFIGNDINETEIRFINVNTVTVGGVDYRGLSSDVTTVTYPLFNVGLINPSATGGTLGGDYNLSQATVTDLNQTELIDADGDTSGVKEARVVYELISDDGADLVANSGPVKYDINGTKITISNSSYGNGYDGVQILSTDMSGSATGKTATLAYRPNGLTTGSLGGVGTKYVNVYDGTSGVNKYVAQIGFKHDTQNYDYNGTKWYLYSEDTGKMYVGIFELNVSGSSSQFVNCADESTNCMILNTTRTLTAN